MSSMRTPAKGGRHRRSGVRLASLLFACLCGWMASAHAQLRLDITQGVRDAVPIAVIPFGGQAEGGPGDVGEIVANDLRLSGRFSPLERKDLVARPTTGNAIRFEDWRLLRSDFIVVGTALIDTLNSHLEGHFSAADRSAWAALYARVSAIMKRGTAQDAAA